MPISAFAENSRSTSAANAGIHRPIFWRSNNRDLLLSQYSIETGQHRGQVPKCRFIETCEYNSNEGVAKQLFIIERTTNGNVVHYDARLEANGQLDSREPVIAYWTMGSATGKRQGLSFLERTRAYGFNVKLKSPGRYVMTVVSQKRVEIEVYVEGDTVRAETSIDGHPPFLPLLSPGNLA